MAVKIFKYNFNIYKGQAVNFPFIWKDANGNLVNVSSYTCTFTLWDNADCKNVIAALTQGNSGVVNGGAAGTIGIYISNAAVTAITQTSGYYKLIVTDNVSSIPRILVTGSVQIIG